VVGVAVIVDRGARQKVLDHGLPYIAVYELSELGALAPRGRAPEEWQLPASALPRLRVMGRLMRDLGVNASGAALAVELLEAQHELERRIRRLERLAAASD